MGLDCGHLNVVWEPRATETLYDFWEYLTENFTGGYVEGFGGTETYTQDDLRNYAQGFEASPEIDQWIEGLFASGNKWVTLVWNW